MYEITAKVSNNS